MRHMSELGGLQMDIFRPLAIGFDEHVKALAEVLRVGTQWVWLHGTGAHMAFEAHAGVHFANSTCLPELSQGASARAP